MAHTAFTVVALKEYVGTFGGGESDTPNVVSIYFYVHEFILSQFQLNYE